MAWISLSVPTTDKAYGVPGVVSVVEVVLDEEHPVADRRPSPTTVARTDERIIGSLRQRFLGQQSSSAAATGP